MQPRWLLDEPSTVQLPPLRSLCLAHTATICEGNATTGTFHQSVRIAGIPPAVQDYLPAQHKIITVCCQVLGSRFKVHVPQQGAPGSLSHIYLATFTSFLAGEVGGASGFAQMTRVGDTALGIASVFFAGESGRQGKYSRHRRAGRNKGLLTGKPPPGLPGAVSEGKLGESKGPLSLFETVLGFTIDGQRVK